MLSQNVLPPYWKKPAEHPPLTKDAVHVWRVSLVTSLKKISEFVSLLAPDEIDRAERFHFERDRNRYIVGRGTLRVLLARYLNQSPQRLRFEYSPYGKPQLCNNTEFAFNLAHSGDMALYAFTRDRQIGVDLEETRADVDCDEVAKRFFSPHEIAAYFALPPTERRAAFFRIWTRKEAYLKAHGEGLSLPLTQFDVSHEAENACLLATRPDAAEASQWRIANLTPGEPYAAALAVSLPEYALSCFQLYP